MTRWPWPADSVLDRSRRVAQAYRGALLDADPVAAAGIDAWAAEHGQSWVTPTEWPYADDDLLTIGQAADACHVQRATIWRWHQRGLPYVDTVDGQRVKARDLLEYNRTRRLARLKRT